jgi:hypothetical protein
MKSTKEWAENVATEAWSYCLYALRSPRGILEAFVTILCFSFGGILLLVIPMVGIVFMRSLSRYRRSVVKTEPELTGVWS